MDEKINDLVPIDIAKVELCVLSAERIFRVASNARGLRELRQYLELLKALWVFCEATCVGARQVLINRITSPPFE